MSCPSLNSQSRRGHNVFSRDRKTWIIYKTHINGNETDIKLVGIKVLKMGCDPLNGTENGSSLFHSPSLISRSMLMRVRTTPVIDISSPPPSSSSNPKKLCRSEKLRQVLKCIHERLWEEDCAIFASEWCNSKAMIESKTITMKQFSTSAYFPYFFRYSVFSLRWSLPRGVSDGTSVNWKYFSFRRMGWGFWWNNQFVINRLRLLHHYKLKIMVFTLWMFVEKIFRVFVNWFSRMR